MLAGMISERQLFLCLCCLLLELGIQTEIPLLKEHLEFCHHLGLVCINRQPLPAEVLNIVFNQMVKILVRELWKEEECRKAC